MSNRFGLSGPDNEDRAAAAQAALEVFTPIMFCERSLDELLKAHQDHGADGSDLSCAVSDLICNLLHYAKREGVDTERAMRMAQSNFDAEVEEAAEVDA